ncbi:hypothetical protein bsdtb5_11350 [Anaeromicropila herbilytica]|uniref:Uncharacterized protein n=1 Tax=Anaeromicropila herbilytica TaxID=2785025 RepID=A0A7R7EJH4_9FIRM|nr:hypothetical protein bsdtb5_11350 [Anaeromicropila herbilytica]
MFFLYFNAIFLPYMTDRIELIIFNRNIEVKTKISYNFNEKIVIMLEIMLDYSVSLWISR